MATLLSTVGSQLDDECLHTFLCEATAIINSRPLSVDKLSDPYKFMPISPSNFLTMKPSIVMSPPGNLTRMKFIVERDGDGYNTYQTSSG